MSEGDEIVYVMDNGVQIIQSEYETRLYNPETEEEITVHDEYANTNN